MTRTRRRILVSVGLLIVIVWLGAAAVALLPGLSKMSNPFSPAPNDEHGQTYGFGSETPRLLLTLGDPATSGLPGWPGTFDAAPTPYDFNGDGFDEIVAQSNDTHVYVFDGRNGRVLAKLATTIPQDGWYIERVLNTVRAGVLVPGEPPSLVVTNHAAFVSVWQYKPAESDAQHFTFEKMWEKRMKDCFWNPGMDAGPHLADLDGNGTLDILVQTEEVGTFALRPDGSMLWKLCWSGGNADPTTADTDGDGKLDVVFASDDGQLSVVDAATGHPKWTFQARNVTGIYPGSISVTPTVAELDGKAPQEILFTMRHAPSGDPELFDTFHMAILAVHQNRSSYKPEVVWQRQPEWAHPLSYTKLVVADVDGDGAQDIFGMDWNTIGHLPGHWELLGRAHVFRLDAQGNDVWVREIDSWWSNKDIALQELRGTDDLDLFANGEYFRSDGVWRLSAEKGTKEGFLSVYPWKVMRSPVTTSLGTDGTFHAIISVTPDDASVDRGAILVYRIGQTTN
jgi:outer membrane protein assembly factor BamB